MSVESPPGTLSAEFDLRLASLTFDALEKAIILSVADDQLAVAAEYPDSLFLLASKLDEFHEEFRNESERLSTTDSDIDRQEASFEKVINTVATWGRDHHHPVTEWIEGGDRGV